MIAYYGERFGSAEHLPPVPDSLEELVGMTMQMVRFTVRDEKIIMTRKVLSIEQFRDERARDLASKHFLTGLTEMFTPVFSGMMEKGLLKRDDPAMLAFAYTAPISALIHSKSIRLKPRPFMGRFYSSLLLDVTLNGCLRYLAYGRGKISARP